MHGKTLLLPGQRPDTANASIEKGRFRRWLRKELPLVVGVATSLALLGVVLHAESNRDSESEQVSLYRKGKIDKSQLSLTAKMRVWDYELVQGGECGDNYRRVLSEIRDEQLRIMETGNTKDVDMLIGIEQIVEKAHRYNLDRGNCPGNASR